MRFGSILTLHKAPESLLFRQCRGLRKRFRQTLYNPLPRSRVTNTLETPSRSRRQLRRAATEVYCFDCCWKFAGGGSISTTMLTALPPLEAMRTAGPSGTDDGTKKLI
jgi:hypothetical protein